LALVQFYDDQTSSIFEWWYSIRVLEKPSFVISEQSLLSPDALKSKINDVSKSLYNSYARNILLNLTKQISLSSESLISLKSALSIFSFEFVSNPHFNFFNDDHIFNDKEENQKTMNAFAENLLQLFQKTTSFDQTAKNKLFTLALAEEATKILENANEMILRKTKTVISTKPPPANEMIYIEGARSLVIIFERTGCTFAQSAYLDFYPNDQFNLSELLHTFFRFQKFAPILHSHKQNICTISLHKSSK